MNEAAGKPVVLIPAYQPEDALVPLVEQLASSGEFAAIIVVNDGSGAEYARIFSALSSPEVHVLPHAVNLGKGAALKTGLNYAACSFPRSIGVVTADADGQHGAEDIVRIARALAQNPRSLSLGARAFDTRVPFRSRLGNAVTRIIMRMVTGQQLSDTQTGLRGIPMGLVPSLLRLRSTGYDFELDMLVACRNLGRTIKEVPISTIYIDNNRSSHFNPLRDSMRIYFVFFRFVAVSLLTALLDNGIFVLAMHYWPQVAVCQAASRLVAATFQFTASRRGVFHSKVRVGPALAKFSLLVAFSGMLSYLLIQALLRYSTLSVVPAKLVAETILFFVSFVVQRDVVFAQPEAA